MDESIVKAAAEVTAASTRATLRAAGMQARNMQCMIMKQRPLYLEEDFMRVIREEGIAYEDVMSKLFQN